MLCLLSLGLNFFPRKGPAPTTKGSTVVSYFSENVTLPFSNSLETFALWESNIVIGKTDMIVSCSARQAKRSHLRHSQPTTRANRMSAEKTVQSTSARWAARPTADPTVCLQALIAGHVTSTVYLTKIGLRVKWSPQDSCPGNLTGIWQACFLLFCQPWKADTANFVGFYVKDWTTVTYDSIVQSVFVVSFTLIDWPSLHEEDSSRRWGLQRPGRGAWIPRPPCGGLCPPGSCCAAQRPGWGSHHHQVIHPPCSFPPLCSLGQL